VLLRRVAEPGWLLRGACGLLLGAVPLSLFKLVVSGDGNRDTGPILLFAVLGLVAGLCFRWKLYPCSRG
jgi:hypothetical protein